jgi:hypothetical protein
MASKAEVRNFIKENFKYEDSDDLDFLKLLVEREDGRSQVVYCTIGDHGLIINSIFATADDITPAQVMKLSEDSILGVKKIDNFFAVTNYVPIADVDASEINKGIFFCAIQADDLEAEVGGDRF